MTSSAQQTVDVRGLRIYSAGQSHTDILPSRVQSITISREVGKHESSDITLRVSSRDTDRLLTSLVSFSFGSGAGAGAFYGYVYGVSKGQKYGTDTLVTINCVGVSKETKSLSVPRVYNQVIADQVAKSEASSSGMAYFTSNPSDFKVDRLITSGYSSWVVITTACALKGNFVSPIGGTIYSFNVRSLLDSLIINRFLSKSAKYGDGSVGTILDFDAGISEASDSGPVSYGYFNANNEAVITTVGGNGEYRDSDWVTSLFVADHRSVGRDSWVRSWSHSATARIEGEGSIYPGSVVSVSTGASHTVSDVWDGPWVVTAVKHELSSGSFQTQLSVVRDKPRKVPYGLAPHTDIFTAVRGGMVELVGDKWSSRSR